MVTESIIKYLLCDTRSLRDYSKGNVVTFSDVRRRMMLLKRAKNIAIPDHYYQLNQKESFKDIDSIPKVITCGLGRIAMEYLELKDGRVYVKQMMCNQWQELITYIPPLLLQVAFLNIKKPLVSLDIQSCRRYFNEVIYPNFRSTSLPSPYVPQLLSYINDKKGLNDLHMHLNGSTETDAIWQNMLFNPEQAQTNFSGGKIVEQLEQEDVTSEDFYNNLKKAQKMRALFADLLDNRSDKQDRDLHNLHHLLSSLERTDYDASIYHPLLSLFENTTDNPEEWMSYEALLYSVIFVKLERNENEGLAMLFHYYILLLGQTNRLIVQQEHQFGFIQFQKITKNDLRRNSEKDYFFRFKQLHGNDDRFIGYLEGRFAPRPTQGENESLINAVKKGWAKLFHNVENPPTLKLIAHFIKRGETWSTIDPYIRHKNLRTKLWKDSHALGAMIRDNDESVTNFVGIDAASSEFDAPPEVFAPVYRYMRHCGVRHFTFHAGEDFYHILSGLRAIYETIEFLDLGCGDRIGHGTALGVSPEVWESAVGEEIYITKGEYLDDLIFTYHFIVSYKCEELCEKLHLLESKIQEYHCEIYGKAVPVQIIVKSWLLRKYCPMMLLSDSLEDAKVETSYHIKEWDLAQQQVPNFMREKNESLKLLEKYHYNNPSSSEECHYRKRYDDIIKINIYDVFKADELVILQKKMLELLHSKEIIIETLPTSNVRIGFHKNFDTYHLWNWLEWQKQGKAIPPIVLGTDDAGIFATNIYNEYANIYCHMVHSKKISHNDAIKVIEQIDKSAMIYNFDG